MNNNNNPFTLTDALVTIGFLVTGLLVIFFFNDREMKRLKHKEENRYPSATRKYSKEVERLLELDDHEKALSN